MILDFDSNPNLTPEDKLRSLKESTQRALEESASNSERLYKALLTALGAETSSLSKGITSLSERLEREAKALADAISDLVERLEQVERSIQSLDQIEQRIGSIESTLIILDQRVTALEERE